jgi:hypothetical protein
MHFINIMNDTVEFQGSFRMIMVENGVAGMSISKGVTKAAICQSIWPLFKRLEIGQTDFSWENVASRNRVSDPRLSCTFVILICE